MRVKLISISAYSHKLLDTHTQTYVYSNLDKLPPLGLAPKGKNLPGYATLWLNSEFTKSEKSYQIE